jgi:hypothetical protein
MDRVVVSRSIPTGFSWSRGLDERTGFPLHGGGHSDFHLSAHPTPAAQNDAPMANPEFGPIGLASIAVLMTSLVLLSGRVRRGRGRGARGDAPSVKRSGEVSK